MDIKIGRTLTKKLSDVPPGQVFRLGESRQDSLYVRCTTEFLEPEVEMEYKSLTDKRLTIVVCLDTGSLRVYSIDNNVELMDVQAIAKPIFVE